MHHLARISNGNGNWLADCTVYNVYTHFVKNNDVCRYERHVVDDHRFSEVVRLPVPHYGGSDQFNRNQIRQTQHNGPVVASH